MQQQASYPEVYTVEEFAKLFKLSPEAVRNLIRRGEISAIPASAPTTVSRKTSLIVILRKRYLPKNVGLACGGASPCQASHM